MNCEPTRNWLLNTDDPARAESTAPEVAAHIGACAVCRELQIELVNLEQRWRGLPLPAHAELAKAAFLARLQNPPTPAHASRHTFRPALLPRPSPAACGR